VSLAIGLAMNSSSPLRRHAAAEELGPGDGCVHGTGITTVDESGTHGIAPQRFVLTGGRSTLSALKKHSGHLEQVTGTLKRGTADGGTRVGEKKIDKGRVYVGAGSTPFERPGVESDAGVTSTIEVRDFVHIGDRCASVASGCSVRLEPEFVSPTP
jgi:hypothetical protein